MKSIKRAKDGVVIKEGSFIKSWSFEPSEGRPDRYVIGRVARIRQDGTLDVEVFEDAEFPENPRDFVIVPVDMLFSDYEGRIIIVK